MKKIGTYTLRGSVEQAMTEKVILFDGRFDTGYRITKFVVAPDTPYGNRDCYLVAKTEDDGQNGEGWNWEDNRQIAWGSWNADGIGTNNDNQNFIDPDNMIVEDLYLSAGSNQGGDKTNYLIVMEKYDITDWQGALAMVRNKSQA